MQSIQSCCRFSQITYQATQLIPPSNRHNILVFRSGREHKFAGMVFFNTDSKSQALLLYERDNSQTSMALVDLKDERNPHLLRDSVSLLVPLVTGRKRL